MMQKKSFIIATSLWGILAGAMWYSAIVFFPPYLTHLPESTSLVTGPYGIHEENFWYILQPLLLIAMVVMLYFNWKLKEIKKSLYIILVIYVLAMLTAAFYFVPELIAFAKSKNSEVPAGEWLRRGAMWRNMAWIRGVVMSYGFVLLLNCLTKINNKTP